MTEKGRKRENREKRDHIFSFYFFVWRTYVGLQTCIPNMNVTTLSFIPNKLNNLITTPTYDIINKAK